MLSQRLHHLIALQNLLLLLHMLHQKQLLQNLLPNQLLNRLLLNHLHLLTLHLHLLLSLLPLQNQLPNLLQVMEHLQPIEVRKEFPTAKVSQILSSDHQRQPHNNSRRSSIFLLQPNLHGKSFSL